MAISRSWRSAGSVDGPHRAGHEHIGELNEVFSAAFTDRYRRDGLSGVRVPYLNPAIWRYAIEDADEGAMIWRDDRGNIAAFNMVHQSGSEGWMGPLAVRADQQGKGLGKEMVLRGVDWLRERGAGVIGLETMPRTVDNIGFYARLGFIPGHLTLTLTLDAASCRERRAVESARQAVTQCGGERLPDTRRRHSSGVRLHSRNPADRPTRVGGDAAAPRRR